MDFVSPSTTGDWFCALCGETPDDPPRQSGTTRPASAASKPDQAKPEQAKPGCRNGLIDKNRGFAGRPSDAKWAARF